MNNSIEIQLEDAKILELHEIAHREGITPQQFAKQSVLRAIAVKRGQCFEQAKQEVLEENRELLRRLAQ